MIGSNVRIPKTALATWLDETAMEAVKDQVIADYISQGRNTEPTELIGAIRKPRNKKSLHVG